VLANAESTKNFTLPVASDGATVAVNVTAAPVAGVPEESLSVVEVEVVEDELTVINRAADVLVP